MPKPALSRSLHDAPRRYYETALLALSGAAIPAPVQRRCQAQDLRLHATGNDGVCVSAHRVKGTPAPYKVGYVFGPDYSLHDLRRHAATLVSRYYHLDPNGRYVYSNGYVYVVDPTTYAVTRVIDTWPH